MTGKPRLHCRSVPSDTRFAARCRYDRGRYLVAMSGELDAASRRDALEACLPKQAAEVVVDLHDLEFLDCGGYRALVAAREILELFGGSLELTRARGEPLRLLSLIPGGSEPAPVRLGELSVVPTLVGVMSIDPDSTEMCRSRDDGADDVGAADVPGTPQS